jgi:hypothetical protein
MVVAASSPTICQQRTSGKEAEEAGITSKQEDNRVGRIDIS